MFVGIGEQAQRENYCWLWGDGLRGWKGGNPQQGMPIEEDRTAMGAGRYCRATSRGRSCCCNLSLPTCRHQPTTIKEACSALAIARWLLSNKICSLRDGPLTPAPGSLKKPGQGWPSHTLHGAPEKALTRAISLEPVAARFPAHLAPLGLLGSKQTTSAPGPHWGRTKSSKAASRPDSCGWTTRRGGDKPKAEPQGRGD